MAVLLIMLSIPIFLYIYYFGGNTPSKNPDAWGPFGDFFGGVLNPIISFFTLLVTTYIAYELTKLEDQRNDKVIETTYKPELIIEEKYFHTYAGNHFIIDLPTEISYEKKGGNYKSDRDWLNDLELELYNIGVGPAKNIEYVFNFQIENVIKYVNERLADVPEEKRILIKPINDNLTWIEFIYRNKKDEHKAAASAINAMHRQKINHLLSVSLNNRPYLLKVPYILVHLYTIAVYSAWKGLKMTAESFNNLNFPPFFIDMTYSDLGNKTFKKRFKVEFLYSSGSETDSVTQLKITESFLES
jgi:hypothetical protein